MSRRIQAGLAAAAAALLFSLPMAAQQKVDPDPQLQSEVQHALNKKQFAGVQVSAQNGVVTLTGSVERLSDKLSAASKAEHFRPLGVRNMIRVTSVGEGAVSDQELFNKLAKQLAYDRQGYGTLPFNTISIQVHNGVVEVSGLVVEPVDKDSAMSIIANTKGVRDVIDHLQVAPLSSMDNRVRRDEYNAIYGYPALNKYAIDPSKPIRIGVVNGNVVLNGVVDSEMDKNLAGIRANGVPGVFSVKNNLVVRGQVQEQMH